MPPTRQEVEIKFLIKDLKDLARRLRAAGFKIKTRRTHERNVLFDLPGRPLRRKREMLRLRQYGRQWTLTHKSKGKPGRYKSRGESETVVEDGEGAAAILHALGYRPSFVYEKFRTEWEKGDGSSHVAVVVDETPIGDVGEIEGQPRWIETTARRLRINRRDYIVSSYAELFAQWKRRHQSRAEEMTWKAVSKRKRKPSPRS